MNNLKAYFSTFTAFQLVLVIALGLFLWPFIHSTKIYSSQSFNKVDQQMINALDPEVYPAQDNLNIKRYLNLDPASFEEIRFYRLDDAMSANEMLIAKSDNEKALASFKEAAANRRQSQRDIYEGYAPEQAAMMDAAFVDVQGNYAIYYAGPDAAKINEQFLQALKGD